MVLDWDYAKVLGFATLMVMTDYYYLKKRIKLNAGVGSSFVNGRIHLNI